MKKVRLYTSTDKYWRYNHVPDDEAQKIADAFMAGETFSILINADNPRPTYRSYYNSFQLSHIEIEDENQDVDNPDHTW